MSGKRFTKDQLAAPDERDSKDVHSLLRKLKTHAGSSLRDGYYDADANHPGLEEDATHPALAYPASRIDAESELRGSGLNWSILRLAFVYGDGDGHLASVPPIVAKFRWHPAKTFSLVHQGYVARAVELLLTGAIVGLVVNICDDAPTTL